MEKTDLIFLKLFCPYHRQRTWHILGIDGVCRCLECRLEDYREEAGHPGKESQDKCSAHSVTHR